MAALILGNLGFAPLGNDASPVEVSNQFAEGLQFEVAAEDGADGLSLSLGLVDHELLVAGVVAKRGGAAGPFALSP
jgi:hypothetical protein